jgi:hypothetical protein
LAFLVFENFAKHLLNQFFPKRYFKSKSTNKWLRYHQKKVEKHAKIQINHVFLTVFLFDFGEKQTLFNLLWMISQQFVGRFLCKIAFSKRH